MILSILRHMLTPALRFADRKTFFLQLRYICHSGPVVLSFYLLF
jgi:hypothetical protein